MVEDTHAYLVTGLQYGLKPEVHALAILTHSHQRAVERFRKQYSGSEIYSCINLKEAREMVAILEAAADGRAIDGDKQMAVIDDLQHASTAPQNQPG
jgi:hypothetical protein